MTTASASGPKPRLTMISIKAASLVNSSLQEHASSNAETKPRSMFTSAAEGPAHIGALTASAAGNGQCRKD